MGGQPEIGQPSGGGGEGRGRNVVDFLTPLETLLNNARYDSMQVTVPAQVLNSIVTTQNNLTNMVKALSAKKVVTEEKGGKGHDEDTSITKKELRRFVQNRRESVISCGMWIRPLA